MHIVAGDLAKGEWVGFQEGRLTGMRGPNRQEVILTGNILSVEKVDEKKRKEIKATAGWAVAGLVALGPLGMLAGLFMGGNTEDVVVIVELKGSKGGRKFMGVTTTEGYVTLRRIYMDC